MVKPPIGMLRIDHNVQIVIFDTDLREFITPPSFYDMLEPPRRKVLSDAKIADCFEVVAPRQGETCRQISLNQSLRKHLAFNPLRTDTQGINSRLEQMGVYFIRLSIPHLVPIVLTKFEFLIDRQADLHERQNVVEARI